MFDNNYSDIVTIDELCEMLGIGVNTAYKLLSNKNIRAFKIGRKWKIPRESVSEYILKQRELFNSKK